MKRYSKAKVKKVEVLISKGLTNKQISKKTKVLPFTVQYYRTKKNNSVPTKILLERKITKAIKTLQSLLG